MTAREIDVWHVQWSYKDGTPCHFQPYTAEDAAQAAAEMLRLDTDHCYFVRVTGPHKHEVTA